MIGIYGLVYTVILLTVSFFVLITADKLKKGLLKSFGNIIAMLLWVFAALTFVTALYIAAQGYCPMIKMIGRGGMKGAGYHYQMAPHRMMQK